jgi:carbamoyl-phosphate synthase large subunit
VDAIRRLIAREHIDVVLPGTEAEIRTLASHQTQLDCTLIVNPEELIHLSSNKGRLAQWLSQNGFHTPRTVQGHDWQLLVREKGFPLVAKPAENTGGSRFVEILNSDAEVEHYLGVCPDPSGTLFQEYVGDSEGEYTVGVAVSHTGQIIDSIALRRKLAGLSLGVNRTIEGRQYALSTGYSQGFITKHHRVQAVCEELAVKLGARGPLNIQCRLVGNDVYVFEVHPRFSGTTSIRAAVGFNEPDILIKDYLFQAPVRRVNYQTDMVAIRAFSNLLVPLAAFREVQSI